MGGYWPSSFSFVCLHVWTKAGVGVHKHTEKEAWSVKDLLYGFRGNFSCRDMAGSPERAR